MGSVQYSLLLLAIFSTTVVLTSGSTTCHVTGQGWNIQCIKGNNSKADQIVVLNKSEREILISTVSYKSRCTMGERVMYDKTKDRKVAPNATVIVDFEATDDPTCREFFVHNCKNVFTYDHAQCQNIVNVAVNEM